MRVKEEVEVVEVDNRLLLRHGAKAILVDKQVEILYAARNVSGELSRTPK